MAKLKGVPSQSMSAWMSMVCSGEQLSLLVVKGGEEFRATQRADIMLVLSCPLHLPRRQRGIVDTAQTNDVPHLLRKRREALANTMRRRCTARLSGRIGRKVPLVFGDRTHKIGRQAMEHRAVPYKIIDQHWIILAAATPCVAKASKVSAL
jgi:hypothetical protein